jgi:hypothetical protein
VRIERADGTVVPCELEHVGLDDDGFDCWRIATAVEFHPDQGDQIKVDVFPARTGLGFKMPAPWAEP